MIRFEYTVTLDDLMVFHRRVLDRLPGFQLMLKGSAWAMPVVCFLLWLYFRSKGWASTSVSIYCALFAGLGYWALPKRLYASTLKKIQKGVAKNAAAYLGVSQVTLTEEHILSQAEGNEGKISWDDVYDFELIETHGFIYLNPVMAIVLSKDKVRIKSGHSLEELFEFVDQKTKIEDDIDLVV